MYTKFFEEITKLEYSNQEKALALAIQLELEPEEDQTLDDFLSQITSIDQEKTIFEVGKEVYYILTEEEAETMWDEYMENYIDEIILSKLPKQCQCYFDREAWKNDASYDGRGNTLASYDGYENEQVINGTLYYIYRIN